MTRDDAVFHDGERFVQRRAGVEEQAARLGAHFIRASIQAPLAEFLRSLTLVVVGSLDPSGRPTASMLLGRPSFVRSPSEHQLRIDAQPWPGDPLSLNLTLGRPLGVLGLDLQTRRRVRINGWLSERDAHGFTLSVDQAFGNCPKHIVPRRCAPSLAPPQVMQLDPHALTAAARASIERADTCFIASASASLVTHSDDRREGVDVSHRGGPRGFIACETTRAGGLRLTIEDYPGNNAFNTLGNLARHPRAGLLIPDFSRGALLSLGCTTQLEWRGTGRLLHLDVETGVSIEHALEPA